MSSSSLVYVSFDRFPAPKGAATHIAAFVAALAHEFASVDLVTVAGNAPSGLGTHSAMVKPSFRHTELPALGPSLVERVLHFRTHLRSWWGRRKPNVVHIRSIYEGYPIARQKHRWCEKLVFEVNGLPSIELKYHYPQVADDHELMRKLIAQEQTCLDAADLVITVSNVNAAHLLQRGVDAARLCVIPNGVDTTLFHYQTPVAWGEREISLLYTGTLASWQGVRTAIEAVSLYRREFSARLTIAGSGRTDQCRSLREAACELGISDHFKIIEGVSQSELARMHHEADVVLVPLLANDRNLAQGCSPLKLLEGMASGTPVIASDLPVVTEIARNEIDALLVRPGSAKSIKDALLCFRNEPTRIFSISQSARTRIEQQFTWEISQQRLRDAYRRLL